MSFCIFFGKLSAPLGSHDRVINDEYDSSSFVMTNDRRIPSDNGRIRGIIAFYFRK